MIKDILKEVEDLDHRIDNLQNPASEDDAAIQLLGEGDAQPEAGDSLEELQALLDEKKKEQ